MTEFYTSFLFGGIVIAVFSWDQFKHPSYEGARDLTRLVEFLSPSDLRHRRVYWRSYAAYAGMLLLIYSVICIYATIPVLKALGMASGATEAAQAPIVPLALALMMVGLAPSVPMLQKLESKIRFVAHRMSGIPARLLHGTRRLKARPFGSRRERAGLLVPDKDWARVSRYNQKGQAYLIDSQNFVSNLAKILAYRWWIIEKKLALSDLTATAGIERNDAGLTVRIDRMILTLDALSEIRELGSTAGAGLDDATTPPAENAVSVGAGLGAAWKQAEKEVDELATDVCGMFMLRLEHDLLRFDDEGGIDRDQSKARSKLESLLEGLSGNEGGTANAEIVGQLWRRAAWTAVIVAFAWGVLFGPAEAPMPNPNSQDLTGANSSARVSYGFSYGVSAFNIYALAIFTALGLYGGRIVASEDDAEGKLQWPNLVTENWTSSIGPAFRLFMLSAIVAVVCSIGYSLAWTMAFRGISQTTVTYWTSFLALAYTSGFGALVGPVLAIGIVVSVDAWRAGWSRSRTRLWVFGITIVAMATLAPAMHILVLEYQERLAYPICLKHPGYDAKTCAPLLFSGIDDLIRRHSRELVLICLKSSIIGAAVLYFCQETLWNQRQRNREEAQA